MKKELRKAFAYRLEPTPDQVKQFFVFAGATRFVFNWGLGKIKETMDAGKDKKPVSADGIESQCADLKSQVAGLDSQNKQQSQEPLIDHNAKTLHSQANVMIVQSQDKTGEDSQNNKSDSQAESIESQLCSAEIESQKLPAKRGKLPNFFSLCPQLTVLKKQQEFAWLNEAPLHALQASLRDLDLAMKHFFRRVKNKEKPGFPKFKSRYFHDAFRYPDAVKPNHVTESHIYLPKIGWVRYTNSRPHEGMIKTMTIKREGKYWFIYLSCIVIRYIPPTAREKLIQIELATSPENNLNILNYTRDGHMSTIDSPGFYVRDMKRLAGIQQSLARKVKGSGVRQKCRERLERMHLKIKNRRKDFLHKWTAQFVRDHDVIVIKGLPIKQMLQDENLSLALSDISWHAFVMMLKYKCEWYGKEFREIKTSPSSYAKASEDISSK